MDAQWEWFCGENSSYMSQSVDWFDDYRNNTCLIDGVITIPHTVFLVLSSLILLVLGCFTSYRKVCTNYLLVYPGHSLRWVLSVLLLVIILASIGEGIMTDETYQARMQPTQPHLYIHSIVAFVAVVLSLVYYHHMEVWQSPAMSVPLFLYWVVSFCMEGLRMSSLEYQRQISFDIILFDVTVIKLAIYCTLAILEANVIRYTCCCASRIPRLSPDLKLPEMKCTHYNVSFFSSVMYWWANWVLALGYRKHLELSDLGLVPERHRAKTNHERFRKAYKEEMANGDSRGSLFNVYMRVYGPRMLLGGFLKIIGELAGFIAPLAVGALTVYVTDFQFPDEDAKVAPAHRVTVEEFFGNGFVLVIVMFLAALFTACCLQAHYYIGFIEGMNAGAAIQTMVYEKSLRLSPAAISSGKMNMGQLTNHMSIDQDAVQAMFQNINLLLTAPLQVAITLGLLYYMIGFSALISASVFLVCTPLQLYVAIYMGKQQKKLLGCSDKRLEKTNELLQGIKLLKMYAWEALYGKAVLAMRRKELSFLYKINIGYVITLSLTYATPVMVTILGFGTYSPLTNEVLTPSVTFAALSLFNMLFLPLILFPTSLLLVINGVVSTRRVQTFLEAPEIAGGGNIDLGLGLDDDGPNGPMRASNSFVDEEIKNEPQPNRLSQSITEEFEGNAYTERSRLIGSKHGRYNGVKYAKRSAYDMAPAAAPQKRTRNLLRHGVAIEISSGTFVWDPASDVPVLSDISVEIPEGKLTLVIGQVGSGKTSLVSAILGEMARVSGSLRTRDGYQIGLAAQKPWLINGSLRDNILFSQPFDAKRYKRVIESCALKTDIDLLPAGDQTEIGEKGLNLSGGQKQRVSVARALYSGRDIIILDDPLSALDVHVGSHLFQEGIRNYLLSHRQTVVLVTHQLQYLGMADLIIKMEDGKICSQGALDDIISGNPDVYNEYDQAMKHASESAAEFESSGHESESMKEDRMIIQEQIKTLEYRSKASTKTKERTNATGSIVEKEEMERGSVSYKVYLYYARHFGLGVAILTCTLSAMFAGFNIGANFWLSGWAESGLDNNTSVETQQKEFIGGFIALEMTYLLSRAVGYGIIVWGMLRSAKRLHENMILNIIKVPLRFFDTVPIGRILNRFSNDTGLIDVKMPQTILIVISAFLNTTSAVLVNTIVIPVFLALFVPVGVAFFFLQKFFLESSRELQRLNSTSKSPVLALFNESVTGLTTIRAYNACNRFYNRITDRINSNIAAFMYLQTVVRWVCIRLDFLGAVVVLIAGMSTLVGSLTIGIAPSLVGLAVSYTLQVSQFLNYLTRMLAELEMQMNAVERVKHYTGIANETYQGEDPPTDWPVRGNIAIDHISVRYAKDTETVLSDVTVDIRAGQKVGICGRTGSGKSSLTLALLRVIDIFQGRVLIDGIDIKSVPLTTLRRHLSLIPQDPVLFTGTIRMNMDPLSPPESSDGEIWHALEIAQLKDIVSSLEGGLDFQVNEGGENFSVGQRQLFCLARAFLRKSRILIMDEATASMDLETDRILQKVVEKAFAERTVLTIAHRITTILNSDVILVLDKGTLAEFGTPDELLANEDGMFTSFVRNKE